MGFSGFAGLLPLVEPWAWVTATPGLAILLVGLALAVWPTPARRRLQSRLKSHFGSQPGLTNRMIAIRCYLLLPAGKGNRIGRFFIDDWEEFGPDYRAMLKVALSGYGLAVVGLFCALTPIALSIFF